jgi:hypothetical protein
MRLVAARYLLKGVVLAPVDQIMSCFWRASPSEAITHSSQHPCGSSSLCITTMGYHWWPHMHGLPALLRAESALLLWQTSSPPVAGGSLFTSFGSQNCFSANHRRFWLSRHQITTPNTGFGTQQRAARGRKHQPHISAVDSCIRQRDDGSGLADNLF